MSDWSKKSTGLLRKANLLQQEASEYTPHVLSLDSTKNLIAATYGLFGQRNQVSKIAEETEELHLAAIGLLDGTATFSEFTDELADVSILIAQFNVLYQDEIDERIKFKLGRLLCALTSEEGKYSKH